MYVSMTFAIFFLFLWIAFIFSVHIPVGMFDHFVLFIYFFDNLIWDF